MITLKTLAEASAQAVYDQIVNHLREQREPSYNVDQDTCMYRHDGLKCAAGCLIADDEYDHSFEANSWKILVDKQKVPNKHNALIRSLQKAHDHSEPHEWEIMFKQIAQENNLIYTPPLEPATP